MVSTRSGGRSTVTQKSDGGTQGKKRDLAVVEEDDKPKRKKVSSSSSSSSSESEEGEEQVASAGADYEEHRAQRMKENMERMKSLGIFDLSKHLRQKPATQKKPKTSRPQQQALLDPPRRSYRLKTLIPVNYAESRTPMKGEKVLKDVEIHIEEGKKPEVYTDEHEMRLGDSKTAWELNVDGYDEEGQRMYDPYLGKSCHQCRQKTLGLRTKCSNCELVSGQFCGDCLYTRYGENVMEANENPNWVCPVCRDICNCSRCRRMKGWGPTGHIYRKVSRLGFKSVAHYLIQTFRSENKTQAPLSPDVSFASADNKDETNTEEKDGQPHGDDEYEADDSDDDFADADCE